jgi:hypothetical protein
MPIWDDIRRGARAVLDESNKLGRVGRLKGQVRSLEATLGDRIYELGTQVLELHRRNELHHYELDQLFVEIQSLQRELREREAEIDQLSGHDRPGRSQAACPDCGGPVTTADRFCRKCGANLRG